MNSLDSIKMNKNSKSRIPVPVAKQKSAKLCSGEESLETRSCLLKKQTADVNKTTKVYLTQKNPEKKTGLQPEKSKKLKDSNRNPDFKKKPASLKSSLKCGRIITTNIKTFENNIKSSDNNKLIAFKPNMRSNSVNKGITKTFNKNINTNSKKTLSSSETKTISKSVVDKKENLPSPVYSSLEQEVCTPRINQIASKQDCFSTHENVEFEANEIYRNMILSNTELSPSVRKLMPSLRLSSLQAQRPSIYQKMIMPADPLKEALKALENKCLSATRIRKEDKLTQSPRRETFRDSIYTPHGDPNEEFLKKLENFKLKQLQKTAPKSTKKVTFNLNIQECTPKNICDIEHNLLKNSEHRLMQINEKSEENTPNSPHSEMNDEIKLNDISLKHEHSNVSNRTIKTDKIQSPTEVYYKDSAYSVCNETKVADQSDISSKSRKGTLEFVTPYKLVPNIRETTLQILKEISCENSSPDFVCDSKNNENYANSVETNKILPSEQKQIKQSAKIYTPKPISFSIKSILNQSYSPEFLVNSKSVNVTDLAPICTPLVLKRQAKNIMFSPEVDEGPIPLKLDFTEEEKDSPKKETCKNHTLFSLGNIVTIQKQFEELADQECYLSLINENFPVICGRYLTNPVARTLNEGDDMHFIPILF